MPTAQIPQATKVTAQTVQIEGNLEQALEIIKDFHLVYDTNIFDKLTCDNAKHRNAVVLISAQNTPVICDTVYWEWG